jgi:lantibiotic biosynthesis protein
MTQHAFIETAARLGGRVCREALWAEGQCNWINPVMEPIGGRWRQVYKVAGPDLYAGTSGIALALAVLHRDTGDPLFRRAAIGAMSQAMAQARSLESAERIGLYSGCVGIALAALKIDALFGTDRWHRSALQLVEEVTGADIDRTRLDILAGCAGAVVGLLRIGEIANPQWDWLGRATSLGDHLIECADRDDRGWSWSDPHATGKGAFGNLVGFSHGTAGVGTACVELFAATQFDRFLGAANQAFAYERHWFSADTENWPDLRDPELSGGSRAQGITYMNAWCHGAPGIALSRLRTWALTADEQCRQEAAIAISTTIRNLYGNAELSQTNYSLCHGLGGNCEALLYGAEILGQPDLRNEAVAVAKRGIETYQDAYTPWPCGGPAGLECAGLLQGLSGIAYFYLRVADPVRTAPVLIFVPQK